MLKVSKVKGTSSNQKVAKTAVVTPTNDGCVMGVRWPVKLQLMSIMVKE
jgi:hypothetical protein